MKKMKICLVSRKFDKKSGSAIWIYAADLKEELIKRKFEVFTIYQKWKNTGNLRKFFHDFFIIPIKLIKLRFNGIKIVHFLNENQAIWTWFANIIGYTTITTHHDFMALKSKGLRKKYFELIYKLTGFSKVSICNSEKTKKELIKYVGRLPNVFVVYPIIIKKKKLRKNPNRRNLIGYLGSLQERKNPEFLIEVMKYLPKEYKMEIWGNGPLKKKLLKEVITNRLDNVKIMGYAPNEKISEIYNSFSFFIFPTKLEGLGLPIIEAMSYGNPVFILEGSIIPKEIKKCCICCKNPKEIAEKIKELSKNKKEYKLEVKRSYACSKRFSKEENLNKLIKIYKIYGKT